jgi:putative phosphoribosyl transferase
MIFVNRAEAGRSLALPLNQYAGRTDVVVLGIPRGGVPVAFEIANALQAPLDVLLLRKLGAPGHEEFAFGAIASGGAQVLDHQVVGQLGLSRSEVETITAREREELFRREKLYRQGLPPLQLAGKIVILIDDGVATGASLTAGIRALRQLAPTKLVVAVPVAPPEICRRLADEVDEIVCVATPEDFRAVSQFYDDFSEVADIEVISLLARIHRAALNS